MCVVVNLNVRKQLWPVPVSDLTKLRHLATVSLSLQFADIKSALGRHIVHGFKRKTEVRQHWLWQILFENDPYLHNLHFATYTFGRYDDRSGWLCEREQWCRLY